MEGLFFLGSWVGTFFLFSVPAAPLHHPGHYSSAVKGEACLLRLLHLPHQVRKVHPFAKLLKFLLAILGHFRFLLSWVDPDVPQDFLLLPIRRRCGRKGYRLILWGRITAPGGMVRDRSPAWFWKDFLIRGNLSALSPRRPPTAKRPYRWPGRTGGNYFWVRA